MNFVVRTSHETTTHTSQQFIGIKSVLVKSIETSTFYERQEYKEDVVKVKSFDKMSPNQFKSSPTYLPSWNLISGKCQILVEGTWKVFWYLSRLYVTGGREGWLNINVSWWTRWYGAIRDVVLGDREHDMDYVWICLLLSTTQDIVGKIYQSPAFQSADVMTLKRLAPPS